MTMTKNSHDDSVNGPQHYRRGRIECIDYLEDQGFNYHRASAVKYITRAGRKDALREVEDLQKAAWYIAREILRITNGAVHGNINARTGRFAEQVTAELSNSGESASGKTAANKSRHKKSPKQRTRKSAQHAAAAKARWDKVRSAKRKKLSVSRNKRKSKLRKSKR